MGPGGVRREGPEEVREGSGRGPGGVLIRAIKSIYDLIRALLKFCCSFFYSFVNA